MALADFESLCSGYCELAAIASPRIEPDAQGRLAAHVRVRGVTVTLVQFDARAATPTVFLVAEFGAPPEEHALNGWLVLLRANYRMIGENAPVFGRNPGTGDVLLHWACPLASSDAADVRQRIEEMVDLALLWRGDFFLSGLPVLPRARSSAFTPARLDECNARFEDLYVGLCRDLGQAVQPSTVSSDIRAFPIMVDRTRMTVVHSGVLFPQSIIVVVDLDRPAASQLRDVTEPLEANCRHMAWQPAAGVFGCDESGQLLLQHTLPLYGVTPSSLLALARALADAAMNKNPEFEGNRQ